MKVVDYCSTSSPLLPKDVGETPLVEVDGIFAKLECVNPLGSIKDRVAAYIIQSAHRTGELAPGQTIVEATSGNTGIALAYYGREFGHPVVIVMPDHMNEERKKLLHRLGAEVILCSKEGSFAEAAEIRDRYAEEHEAFNPDQFSSLLNTECHRLTTGNEIVCQVGGLPLNPVFVAGVGTGGTLLGVGAALKQAWGKVSIVAVEPAEAAVMTGGRSGPHGIAGIGDGFIPDLAGDGQGGLHPMIDSVEVVTTVEAKDAAVYLRDRHGLCVGMSSGANYVAAARMKDRFATIFTVFPDGHQKYESDGLCTPPAKSCPFSSICAQSTFACLLDDSQWPSKS